MDEEAVRDAWVAEVKDRMRAKMAGKDLSHRQLSSKVGVRDSTISSRLTKGTLSEWWWLARICQELETSPDELLGFPPTDGRRAEALAAAQTALMREFFLEIRALADRFEERLGARMRRKSG